MASVVFWISLAIVAYAYAGYAVCLMILVRLRPRPVQAAAIRPSVSILIAAHNEEANLERKLQALYALSYPASQREIIVVSDGSTDATNSILEAHAGRVTGVHLPTPSGKAVALNHAATLAQGDILVFMDVRQSVDREAIEALVAPFADPGVGAVSGELHLEDASGRPSSEALGIYWKIEKTVRRLESATGSVVGVTGALFALRRELFVPLPAGTLLDDVLTPLNAARSGMRILFTERAVARDRLFVEPGKEFSRKVRTLTGNYQLLQLAPWLLTTENPLLFRLISHKLLRLAVPFLLIVMLISSAASRSSLDHILFFLQLMLYLAAAVGYVRADLRRFKLLSIPFTFAMLNVAAGWAFYNLLRGRARWA